MAPGSDARYHSRRRSARNREDVTRAGPAFERVPGPALSDAGRDRDEGHMCGIAGVIEVELPAEQIAAPLGVWWRSILSRRNRMERPMGKART